MKILSAFSLLLLFSCQNNSTNQSMTSKAVEKDILVQPQQATDYCNQYDIVHGDSVKIDGKARIIDSKKAMLALFGKPTRSEKIEYCVSYFLQKTDKLVFIYFKKTGFESCKDSVALGRLDFPSTDRQLVFPNITLTKNTKLSDLAAIFPKSFAIRYPIGEKDKKQMVVPLIFFPCSDDKLLLIFENEQLVAVDYYMAC